MARLLFATQPSSGHLNPLLAIAGRLRERGHEVLFCVPVLGPIADALAGAGFRALALPARPTLVGLLAIRYARGWWETAIALHAFTASTGPHARAVAKLCERERIDGVVADFTFAGAQLGAELRRLPFATVYHAGLGFPGPGVPPFGSGLPIGEPWGEEGARAARRLARLEGRLARKLARARRSVGLAPGETAILRRPPSPYLNLVLSTEWSEAPRDPLPPTTFFVGPCLARGGDDPGTFPVEFLEGPGPRIYASLGTVFNDRPEVFRRILSGIGAGWARIVVGAGKAASALRRERLGEHVLVMPTVPQRYLLGHVDAFVTHGGNNSVNEALAAGVPMLALPVGGEQRDNAARVVYLGVGVRAGLDAGAAEIGAKVRRLVEDPGYRARARGIAARVSTTDGAGSSAVLVERMLRGTPVRRGREDRVTVTLEGARGAG